MWKIMMLNTVTIMVFACITLIDWQIMPVGSSVCLLSLLSSILIIIKPFTRGFLKKQRMPHVADREWFALIVSARQLPDLFKLWKLVNL